MSRLPRGSRVIDVHEGDTHLVSENIRNSRVVRDYINPLESRVINPQRVPHGRSYMSGPEIELEDEEPYFVERVVDKPVEIKIERKVPYQRIVEIPYDVVVEKNIERIIEKEVEIEKLVYKDIEKTIEVPYERVVERHIEELIE